MARQFRRLSDKEKAAKRIWWRKKQDRKRYWAWLILSQSFDGIIGPIESQVRFNEAQEKMKLGPAPKLRIFNNDEEPGLCETLYLSSIETIKAAIRGPKEFRKLLINLKFH